MATDQQYDEATHKTVDNLRSIAFSEEVRELSSMSLPQIDSLVQIIARITPAGNIPAVILNGLARLPNRTLPLKTVQRDINLLFKGVEQMLVDRAVYSTFFAGPAAVIWAYQNLLRLAGKDPDTAFPEGTWQFYLDYALRDDTARHANETHGFDTLLRQHQITLTQVDRMTAWTMAAIYCLHQYGDILENEWYERVSIRLLAEIRSNPLPYHRLYQEWEKKRPYGRGPDVAPQDNYPAYRRKQFDQFLAPTLKALTAAERQEWRTRLLLARDKELNAYQAQMGITAYLEPGRYGETRIPIPLPQTHTGLIFQSHYYLIPACVPGSSQPAGLDTVRSQIAALAVYPTDEPPARLQAVARIKRAGSADLRLALSPAIRNELDTLRLAPIWINFDQQPRERPLATLRQAERAAGDHPLTIFDTGQTFVFDQSHIFFDGAWGAALAEILTNESLAWAVYLNTLPPARPAKTRPYSPPLQISPSDWRNISEMPAVTLETCVETTAVDLAAIRALRARFKERSDLLLLTVNDLLILYRAIHAALYKPAPGLIQQLKQLQRNGATQNAAEAALAAIEAQTLNPSILIPVNASQWRPRDRVFPMTFEVPLANLNLVALHRQLLEALETYQQADTEKSYAGKNFAAFAGLRRSYLGALAGFGEVLNRAKEVAVAGESATVGTIKLLAHLPPALQRLLDRIPNRFDVLNDIIKGREVFSNVGAVVPGSTLTRFMTAKDDNEKKELAWGVITTADQQMHLTLRDFRPHVTALIEVGHPDVATRIAQDYLDAYANGLNVYVHDLQRITEVTHP